MEEEERMQAAGEIDGLYLARDYSCCQLASNGETPRLKRFIIFHFRTSVYRKSLFRGFKLIFCYRQKDQTASFRRFYDGHLFLASNSDTPRHNISFWALDLSLTMENNIHKLKRRRSEDFITPKNDSHTRGS